MYCQKCGAENKDGNKFCISCGADLIGGNVANQNVQQAPVATPQNAQPQPQQQPQQPQQTGYYQQQPVQSAQNYVQKQRIVRDYSADPQTIGQCFGKSWFEMRKVTNWVGRIFLLALIMIVPILNFVALGYLWNLARHAARKEQTPYPVNIFDADNFKNGFFVFVVIAIFAAVCTLCLYPARMWINGYNGILKALAVFLDIVFIGVCIFAPVATGLMKLRIVLIDFASAFHFSEVFRVYGKNFGRNLLVFTVAIAAVVIASYIVFCIVFAIVWSIYVPIAFNGSSIAYYSNVQMDNAIIIMVNGSNAVVGIMLLTIASYCSAVILVAGLQVLVRAQGYYILSFVPEWLTERPAPRVTSSYATRPPMPNQMPSQNVQQNTAMPQNVQQPVTPQKTNNAKPSVKFVAGPGNEFEFSDFPSTIGSAPNASLSVGGDTSLDPVHFVVDLNNNNAICICDNGSKNGTKLNGKKIAANKNFTLKTGDKIEAGSVNFDVFIV